MQGTAWGSTAGEIRLRPSRFSFSPCCAVLLLFCIFEIFFFFFIIIPLQSRGIYIYYLLHHPSNNNNKEGDYYTSSYFIILLRESGVLYTPRRYPTTYATCHPYTEYDNDQDTTLVKPNVNVRR